MTDEFAARSVARAIACAAAVMNVDVPAVRLQPVWLDMLPPKPVQARTVRPHDAEGTMLPFGRGYLVTPASKGQGRLAHEACHWLQYKHGLPFDEPICHRVEARCGDPGG